MILPPIAERMAELAQWARSGKLAVLTGAGVSMLPPSSLPSWWRLNIDAYRAFVADDAELGAFVDAIEKLPLPPSVLAQFLWEILGSEEYPNSLAVLRGGVPNRNHRVIATLAANGLLRDIVTLNFDRLHERALAESGVAYEVNAATPVQASPAGDSGAAIVWKLHGTIESPETIFATLDQTTREHGIGPEKKTALRQIRERANLLVLGYSGGDFFLDPDYLGFVSCPGPGSLIWNMRPGEIVDDRHPLVRLSRERPEIVICEGLLPGVLDSLATACGVSEADETMSAVPGSLGEPAAWTPPAGAWVGHLFSKVFRHVGAAEQELACYRWEARRALKHPGPHRAAWAIEGLAVWYLAHGHREIAKSFLSALYALLVVTRDTHAQQRVRHALGQLYRRYPPASPQRSDCARRLKSLAETAGDASVLNDVGLLQYEDSAHAGAIATYDEALEFIGEGSTALRAIIVGNKALAQAKLGDTDAALNGLARALEIEEAIGNREGMLFHLRNLGHLQIELGQHAAAADSLQQAVNLEDGLASPLRRAETLGMLGDALAASGRVDDALEAYGRAAVAARQSDDPYVWNHLHNFILKKAKDLQVEGKRVEST